MKSYSFFIVLSIFLQFCYFFFWFHVAFTIENCYLNVANNEQCTFVPLFSSSDYKIRRPFASGAQFFSPALRRFFFPFFLRRRRLSLAFLTATRPRDSPADNLRYDTLAVRCSSVARGIREEIFTGLLISSFSLVRKKELATARLLVRTLFSRDENSLSPDKERISFLFFFPFATDL